MFSSKTLISFQLKKKMTYNTDITVWKERLFVSLFMYAQRHVTSAWLLL